MMASSRSSVTSSLFVHLDFLSCEFDLFASLRSGNSSIEESGCVAQARKCRDLSRIQEWSALEDKDLGSDLRAQLLVRVIAMGVAHDLTSVPSRTMLARAKMPCVTASPRGWCSHSSG